MSPRHSAAEAQVTRSRILEKAIAVGATDGFEGVTIGRLAHDLGMSKAGVIGPFGSKEALQLAAFDAAVAEFREQVPGRVIRMRPGLDRLLRLCDAWVDFLVGARPGGCLLTTAATEYDAQSGPLHDAVVDSSQRWIEFLVSEITAALQTGELPDTTDPEQAAFELNGISLATNQAVQLHRDPTAADRARRAVRRLFT
jgi:AcrR family transcriptional regulator